MSETPKDERQRLFLTGGFLLGGFLGQVLTMEPSRAGPGWYGFCVGAVLGIWLADRAAGPAPAPAPELTEDELRLRRGPLLSKLAMGAAMLVAMLPVLAVMNPASAPASGAALLQAATVPLAAMVVTLGAWLGASWPAQRLRLTKNRQVLELWRPLRRTVRFYVGELSEVLAVDDLLVVRHARGEVHLRAPGVDPEDLAAAAGDFHRRCQRLGADPDAAANRKKAEAALAALSRAAARERR